MGITKSMGSGCRYWRIDIYLYGNQKVTHAVLKDRRIGDKTPLILVLFWNKVHYMLFTINVLSCYPIYIGHCFKNIPKSLFFDTYIKWEDHQLICQLL